MPKTVNRKWYRDLFTDHPGYLTGQPEAFLGSGSSAKAKVYCTKCLQQDITAALAEDHADVEAHPPRRTRVREASEIESYRESCLLDVYHCL